MKQLRPRTILAIGISGSLILNAITVYCVLAMLSPENLRLQVIAAISASGWLLFGVPTFCGMALIRHQIGQADHRRTKIRTALASLLCCLLLATTGLWLGTQFELKFFEVSFNYSMLWAGSIGAVLVLLTGINISLRFIFNDWSLEAFGKSTIATK